jgi:hypothetical protein
MMTSRLTEMLLAGSSLATVGQKPAASAGSVGPTYQTLLSPLRSYYRADAGLTGALSL